MLKIKCPHCECERDEIEFHYGGEAHIARPEKPADLTDEEWGDFLFMRTNTKGQFAERWVHSHGCRKWFNVIRDTVTHDIVAVYKMGESRPVIETQDAKEEQPK